MFLHPPLSEDVTSKETADWQEAETLWEATMFHMGVSPYIPYRQNIHLTCRPKWATENAHPY